jgi:hypothetical protein
MIISHTENGSGITAVDRHLIRLNRSELDAGDGVTVRTGSVYCVIEQPRSVVTETMVKDALTQLVDFLTTSGYVDKILNSEP